MMEAIVKSAAVKRSIVISGHKTSVSLEDEFWQGLKEIVRGRSATLSDLVADIDTQRSYGNLSSAIRLFVLDHFRKLPSDSAGLTAASTRTALIETAPAARSTGQ
jgi:predicted DNA-binding ribbon-helix-helix protein